MAGLFETIQNNDMLKVLLILVGVYFFMRIYHRENLDNVTAVVTAPVQALPAGLQAISGKAALPTTQAPPQGISLSSNAQSAGVAPIASATALTTSDLLPKYSDANDFAKQNPVSKLLQEQNFLQAGYHFGINTVIQSNKIPYLDLRSAPPIPKQEVGPWGQSSYEQPAGASRRALEIGS